MGTGTPADEELMIPSMESPSGQRHLLRRVAVVLYATLIVALRWLKRFAPRSMNGRRARRRSRIACLGRFRSFPGYAKDSGVNAVADLQYLMHTRSTSSTPRSAFGGHTVGLAYQMRQDGGPAEIGERVRLPPTYPLQPNGHRAPSSRSRAQEDGVASWHRRGTGNCGGSRLCRLDVLRWTERAVSS
jgi:hypothetical protein